MKFDDDGVMTIAGTFVAQSRALEFMLGLLQAALHNERKAGYTATGAMLEPPLAHIVRPALEQFLQNYQAIGEAAHDLRPDQILVAEAAYRTELSELRRRILEVAHPFEI